jgi:hypothetical protein
MQLTFQNCERKLMALERKARALEFDLNREKGISLTFCFGGDRACVASVCSPMPESLCVLAYAWLEG